jgi:hypothetical protein
MTCGSLGCRFRYQRVSGDSTARCARHKIVRVETTIRELAEPRYTSDDVSSARTSERETRHTPYIAKHAAMVTSDVLVVRPHAGAVDSFGAFFRQVLTSGQERVCGGLN